MKILIKSLFLMGIIFFISTMIGMAQEQTTDSAKSFFTSANTNNIDKEAHLLYKEARRLQSEGNYKEAIECHNKAINMNPRFEDAYYDRGRAYSKLRQYEQAIKDFTDLLNIDSHYIGSYCERGKAYIELGKYDEAIADFNKSLKNMPNNSEVYYYRGNAYRGKKDKESAKKDWEKAVSIDKTGDFGRMAQDELDDLNNE